MRYLEHLLDSIGRWIRAIETSQIRLAEFHQFFILGYLSVVSISTHMISA